MVARPGSEAGETLSPALTRSSSPMNGAPVPVGDGDPQAVGEDGRRGQRGKPEVLLERLGRRRVFRNRLLLSRSRTGAARQDRQAPRDRAARGFIWPGR